MGVPKGRAAGGYDLPEDFEKLSARDRIVRLLGDRRPDDDVSWLRPIQCFSILLQCGDFWVSVDEPFGLEQRLSVRTSLHPQTY